MASLNHHLTTLVLKASSASAKIKDLNSPSLSKLSTNHSCDSVYNLPDNKSMRKTSFGYGRKTDLDYGKHRHNKSPSPDRYKIDTFVDFNKTHQRGSSCHIGRDVSV